MLHHMNKALARARLCMHGLGRFSSWKGSMVHKLVAPERVMFRTPRQSVHSPNSNLTLSIQGKSDALFLFDDLLSFIGSMAAYRALGGKRCADAGCLAMMRRWRVNMKPAEVEAEGVGLVGREGALLWTVLPFVVVLNTTEMVRESGTGDGTELWWQNLLSSTRYLGDHPKSRVAFSPRHDLSTVSHLQQLSYLYKLHLRQCQVSREPTLPVALLLCIVHSA